MDEAVAAFWARAAETYETEVPYFRLMGERIVARAGLRTGQDVLDVACGKGATLIPAARAVGDRGRVVGVDIVPEMVDAARAAAVDAGLANVTVQVGDGDALDLDSASFDVVVCGFGLGFLRPELALAEMRRVLRDGGRLVTSVPMGGGADWDFFGEFCKRYGLVSEAHVGGATTPAFEEMAKLAASVGLFLDPPVLESVSVLFPTRNRGGAGRGRTGSARTSNVSMVRRSTRSRRRPSPRSDPSARRPASPSSNSSSSSTRTREPAATDVECAQMSSGTSTSVGPAGV